jgi:hypothetical protein
LFVFSLLYPGLEIICEFIVSYQSV